MVHNLGPKWLKWSLLGVQKSSFFLHIIYYTFTDTNEQKMSQRHWITLQA